MADDDKEATLKFIEDYRSFPQLWDQSSKLLTNKIKRQDGLQILATKYNMTIDGVKKKIKSLRSYFSKEHQKASKKKSGAGSDEVYHSPWFAYKHLLFTADSVTPRSTKETTLTDEIPVEAEDSYATQRHETPDGETSSTSQSTYFISDDEHEFVQPPIRKKRNIKSTNDDKEKNEAYCFMKTAAEQLTQKDEYTIFGQLVSHKIRNLNPCNRLIAQQRINNILFEVEIEQMNVQQTNTTGVLLIVSSHSSSLPTQQTKTTGAVIVSSDSSSLSTQDVPGIPVETGWRLVSSDDGCSMNQLASETGVSSQQLTDFGNLSKYLQLNQTLK